MDDRFCLYLLMGMNNPYRVEVEACVVCRALVIATDKPQHDEWHRKGISR